MRKRLVALAMAAAALIAPTVACGAIPSAHVAPVDVTRLAIIGDSITDGYGAPDGYGYADRLEAMTPGDNVLPLAVGGATVRRWLPGGPHYPMLDQLRTWRPATVLVNLGTNDYYVARRTSEYQVQLGRLVTEIRARVPNARVILWHQFGGFFAPDPRACDIEPCAHQSPPAPWHDFGVAMRAAAVANGTGYIDDSTVKQWHLWLYDGAHPNTYGHYQLFLSIRDRLLTCC